ncbi:MAG: hypothetical protein ABIW19_13565 [Vicinamibacterales bacterium]
MIHRSLTRLLVTTALLTLGLAIPAQAQYFGQNKVQYDKFDFKVMATPHFDIYYYPSEADAAKQVARMAERWHARLTRLIGYEITGRQAVMLYASHPEFEQTNVVEGMIDEGTGGVTEGLRRRVVLPLAATLGETDHVLGHELVHTFQYDILGNANASSVPLWFIEGMAEYLSMGPHSPQTAMWLRDAVLQDRLPAIKDLDDPRFFPYRFGQALWAYIGGRWGDQTVGAVLKSMAGDDTGIYRSLTAVSAIETATGLKQDELSEQWKQSILSAYGLTPLPKEERRRATSDDLIIGARTGSGALNVGPSLSPDGSKVAFLSERSRLAIDLYVADVPTRKVLRKLTQTEVDPHFQSLQFLASSGTWDPQGRRLAVAAVRAGRPELAIFDVENGKIVQEIPFGQRGEIFQPSWSPDGNLLAFSAQVGGVTDLFVYDFATAKTRQITTDAFADLQPAWSPDGHQLAFVTERFSSDLNTLAFGNYDLALIDVTSGAVVQVQTGLKGNAVNPQWTREGTGLYFISDQTGRPEVYRVDLSTKQSTRIAVEVTGVSGITALSSALSVAPTGRAAYTVFRDGGYEIRFIETASRQADLGAEPTTDLGMLPPVDRPASLVTRELQQPGTGVPASTEFAEQESSSHMSLVDVGQQVGGVSTGGFGTYVSGGISFLFSDMLNNHMISTTVDVNGSVHDLSTDVAFQVAYLNRAHRWNWSVFGARVPYQSGSVQAGTGVLNGRSVYVESTDLFTQTASQVGGVVAYPFSRALRLELGSSVQRIGFSHRIQTQVYDAFNGSLISDDRTKLPSEASLTLFDTTMALVGDTTANGAVGPILGQRFRIEGAPTFGDLHMFNLTADYRRYFMPFRPVTFATRAVHVGRYGGSSEDQRLTPLFLGYPDMVRGYDVNSFQANECTLTADGSCPEFDRLIGSRLGVFNAEARVPLVGLFNGKLDYGPIPVELFGFFDAGVAWDKTTRPSFAGGSRDVVTSTGVGARVNVFGYAIAEFNMARPLSRPDRGWLFVFNLRPGF